MNGWMLKTLECVMHEFLKKQHDEWMDVENIGMLCMSS
jgi:hypothetical protein